MFSNLRIIHNTPLMPLFVCADSRLHNSAENAAMEAKLKKLEAEVTSESHVHIELEKERNALKSRVRIRLVVKMNA